MTTQYQVKGPDGQVHIIEGPDNASPADVMAFAAKAIPSTAPDPSAGGSTLNIAGFDTGIPTSQGVDRVLSGAGKSVADLGNGLRQIGGMLGIGDPAQIQSDIDAAKTRDAALMSTSTGLGGYIGGNLASTVLPMGGVAKGAEALGLAKTANAAKAFVNPTSYLGAATAGGVTGAIQPVATGDSRGLNTAAGVAGGAAGKGVVNAIARIAQPVANAGSAAVQTLQDAGVPLSLGQTTGSPFWNRISSSLGDNIFTAGKQAEFQGAQKAAYTNALLNLIGEDGSAATSDVMGGALDRTNGVFGDVLSRNNVPLTPSLATDLSGVQAAALENEKTPVATIINRTFNAADPATGDIPGQTAYNIVKDMRRMGQSSDSTLNNFAGDAKGALLDGINSSLSGPDLEAFTQARRQQAIMHTLEGAISKDGSGDISPSLLANIMGQKPNRSMSIYGQGPQDLVDLAQAGKQVLPDKTGNSGTAARILASLAPTAVGGIAGGAYGALTGDDPLESAGHAAELAGSAFLAPKALQFIANNPTMVKALSQGVTNPIARAALQAPTDNVMAGLLTRSAPVYAGDNALMQMLAAYRAKYGDLDPSQQPPQPGNAVNSNLQPANR